MQSTLALDLVKDRESSARLYEAGRDYSNAIGQWSKIRSETLQDAKLLARSVMSQKGSKEEVESAATIIARQIWQNLDAHDKAEAELKRLQETALLIATTLRTPA